MYRDNSPIHPSSGKISSQEIKEQTQQSLENLKNILEAGKSSIENVLKTTVFLKNINDFSKMNEIYSTYFKTNFPARVCVEVACLPKDALIEIEAIALVKQ